MTSPSFPSGFTPISIANLLTDPSQQSELYRWFEQLRQSDDGWKQCVHALSSNVSSDESLFICLAVLQDFLAKRYSSASTEDQLLMRTFLRHFLSSYRSSPSTPSYLRNKIAYLYCLAFIVDFPTRWPTFFEELFAPGGEEPTSGGNTKLFDLFLRLLLAIDSEVADAQIARTKEQLERNTLLKDKMRELCMRGLIDTVFRILDMSLDSDAKMATLCMNVLGSYIAWVDIELVVNDRFEALSARLFAHVRTATVTGDEADETTLDVLESATHAYCAVVSKKIDSVVARLSLIETVERFLQGQQIGAPDAATMGTMPEQDTTAYQMLKMIAEVVGCVGVQLTDCRRKTPADQAELRTRIDEAIDRKMREALALYAVDSYFEIAVCLHEFAHEYLQLVKAAGWITVDARRAVVNTLYAACVRKYRFPDSYDHEHEGEDEAAFQEFRKDVRVLMTNIYQIDFEIARTIVEQAFGELLRRDREGEVLAAEDVELAIGLLSSFGEAATSELAKLIELPVKRTIKTLLISSNVLKKQPAKCVCLAFLEMIGRYEKLVVAPSMSDAFAPILEAFLDTRGLRHPSAAVRSRSAYVLAKFLKSAARSATLATLVDDLLRGLGDLLVPRDPNEPDGSTGPIGADDQLFLYEAVGYLLVSGSFSPAKRRDCFEQLIGALARTFTERAARATRLSIEQREPLAKHLNALIAFASRTTKAFSAAQTMTAAGCTDIFVSFMRVMLDTDWSTAGADWLPLVDADVLYNGVRQYLHRMVVCLSADEMLPHVRTVVRRFVTSFALYATLPGAAGETELFARGLQDFLTLMSQIVAKYKKEMLNKGLASDDVALVFNSVWQLSTVLAHQLAVAAASAAAAVPAAASRSRELALVRRNYFQLLLAAVSNDCLEFITCAGGQDVQMRIFDDVIAGVLDFDDANASKSCVVVVSRVVEKMLPRKAPKTDDETPARAAWLAWFFENVVWTRFVPAVLLGPLDPSKKGFDWSDAQSTLVANEIAHSLRLICDVERTTFARRLSVIPHLPQCDALAVVVQDSGTDVKGFQKFLKAYYVQNRATLQA